MFDIKPTTYSTQLPEYVPIVFRPKAFERTPKIHADTLALGPRRPLGYQIKLEYYLIQ